MLCFPCEAQAPDWVTQRPTSSDAYIGIGVASLSDNDYIKKATQSALSDIVSQIAVKLENNSFLHRVDVDGKTREMLEDKIQVQWQLGWKDPRTERQLPVRSKNITCTTLWTKVYACKSRRTSATSHKNRDGLPQKGRRGRMP